MLTKEVWQAAEHEFGQQAFKRFICSDNTEVTSNAFAKGMLMAMHSDIHSCAVVLRFKPLPELFAHDREFYINPELMWEAFNKSTSQWCQITRNQILLEVVNGGHAQLYFDEIRRKTSAALPFDLKRAMAGDAVQTIDKWSFEDPKPLKDVILQMVDGELCFRSVGYKGGDWFKCNSIYAKELRMKYPERKQVG